MLLEDLDGKVGERIGIRSDRRSLVETGIRVIKYGVCLVGSHEVAGANIVKFPFNRNAVIGNIMFWNFTRPSGVHIFEAMVKELKKLGVTHITANSHFPENRIGDFYCKLGLRRVEISWLAEINSMHPPYQTEPR